MAEAPLYRLIRIIPPRPTFLCDMTATETAVMRTHVGYWTEKLEQGTAIVFGRVIDPAGPWWLCVIRVSDEAELQDFELCDPAISAGLGFRYEILPMA